MNSIWDYFKFLSELSGPTLNFRPKRLCSRLGRQKRIKSARIAEVVLLVYYNIGKITVSHKALNVYQQKCLVVLVSEALVNEKNWKGKAESQQNQNVAFSPTLTSESLSSFLDISAT